MADEKPRALTLVGMPRIMPGAEHANEPPMYGAEFANSEEPFPLTPYADIMLYTPSHEVCKNYSTPVDLPRTVSRLAMDRKRQMNLPNVTRQRPLDACRRMLKPGMEPSTLAKAVACCVVCWLLYMGLGATLLMH